MLRMRLPKVKLPDKLLQLAYHFADVEASGGASPPDGRMVEYTSISAEITYQSERK